MFCSVKVQLELNVRWFGFQGTCCSISGEKGCPKAEVVDDPKAHLCLGVNQLEGVLLSVFISHNRGWQRECRCYYIQNGTRTVVDRHVVLAELVGSSGWYHMTTCLA